MCGLIQSTSEIVPCSWVRLLLSNCPATEWCAEAPNTASQDEPSAAATSAARRADRERAGAFAIEIPLLRADGRERLILAQLRAGLTRRPGRVCYDPAPMSASSTPLLSAPRAPAGAKARERILAAAYDLFSRHGIRAVGIDAIIEQSGVARMTLYRHFVSKEQLVLAFLAQRERFWSGDWLETEVMRRGGTARDRLLGIFDVFGEWFATDGFEGCTFINVLLETTDREDAARQASVDYLRRIREFLASLASQAGVNDSDAFARKWHILMKGSIVAAAEGDREAAARAKEIAALLL